jgi:hypothetical protein
MKPVFIMSSERSGSNLVREILNSHPNISAPPAAHLPRFLSLYRPFYDDLSVDTNMQVMIANAIDILNVHPERLEFELGVDEILNSLTERSLWGVIAAIYSLNAQKQGKSVWASKDNDLFNYVFPIKHTLPDARFIYLVRDGRDYVCSMRRLGVPNSHIYVIAKQWQREQQACIQVYYAFKESGSVHLMRYEDLLTQPELALQQLCKFLDEPFDERMLDFHAGGTAKKLATESAYWENLSKPLMKTNFAKFKKELKPREIGLVESVMGRELLLLGYPLVSEAPIRELSRLLRLWYTLQNTVLKYWNGRNLKKKEPWRQQRSVLSRKILKGLSSRSPQSQIAEPLRYD